MLLDPITRIGETLARSVSKGGSARSTGKNMLAKLAERLSKAKKERMRPAEEDCSLSFASGSLPRLVSKFLGHVEHVFTRS